MTGAHVLRARAERIVTANRYVTLSTCDASGPWALPSRTRLRDMNQEPGTRFDGHVCRAEPQGGGE